MPRFRALSAILLAVTWCSAVWHVDLEAVGLMFDHQHHEHAGHAHSLPGALDDPHEQVFARNAAQDGQIRVGATVVLWFTLAGAVMAAALNGWRIAAEREPVPIEGRSDPPLEKAWQFLWRCAPDSAAPPALH